MADARQLMTPLYKFSRLDDMVILHRENGPTLKM